MFLNIIGAVVFTLICLWPIRTLMFFLYMSDYGILDTIKWNFFKEKLWIEAILIPIACIAWWHVVGSHLDINFN
jgi:hypothetical protein